MLYFSVLWMHTVATSCRGGQTAPAIAKVVFFAKKYTSYVCPVWEKIGFNTQFTPALSRYFWVGSHLGLLCWD